MWDRQQVLDFMNHESRIVRLQNVCGPILQELPVLYPSRTSQNFHNSPSTDYGLNIFC